jgi:hypothetical protein
MKKLKYIDFSLVYILFTVSLFVGLTIDAEAYKTKANSQNQVRVDVRPIQLFPGNPVKFEIRMNSHSVDLGEDIVAVSTLKDNQGHEYRPTNWQGSPPGGHHRKGVLEFPALDGAPVSISLVIRQIANVPERIFEWTVEN